MRPLLLTFAGLIGFVACFVDTPEPPAFRFDCSSDADCNDPERCISGLCQIPCSFATFNDDCPSSDGYTSCFNGVCSHLCSLSADEPCPAPQKCQGIELDESGLGGGGFGGGSIDTSDFGICGELCDDADLESCPEGELCLEGVCIPLPDGGTDGGTDDTGGTGW